MENINFKLHIYNKYVELLTEHSKMGTCTHATIIFCTVMGVPLLLQKRHEQKAFSPGYASSSNKVLLSVTGLHEIVLGTK